MDIGKLNKRITIQKREIFINENGFEVEGWKDYKIVWASIKNLNGKEFFPEETLLECHKTVGDLLKEYKIINGKRNN